MCDVFFFSYVISSHISSRATLTMMTRMAALVGIRFLFFFCLWLTVFLDVGF